MEVEGRVAMVTGGGSGIGAATADLLVKAGARVAIVDADADAGLETAERLSKEGDARFVRGDVADPRSVAAFFDEAVATLGVPAVVFNNAGLMVSETPPWPDAPLERVHQVVAVNGAGVVMGTRQAVEVMRGSGGVVINTASIAALTPLPQDPVYAGTKALVVHFTRSCARLAETHGVRVNAVLPGVVDTPLLARSGDGTEPPPWLSKLLEQIPALPPRAVGECVMGLIGDDSAVGVCRIVDPEGERDV